MGTLTCIQKRIHKILAVFPETILVARFPTSHSILGVAIPSEDQSRATFKQGTVLMQQGSPSEFINDNRDLP